MATTYSRTSGYMSAGWVGLYTNSTSKPQRILVTDILFAADSAYYSNDMNGIALYIVKRADPVSSAFTSTIFYGNLQYTYSMYANFSSTHGAGSNFQVPNTNSSNAVGQVVHYCSSYSTIPNSNTSSFQTPTFGDQNYAQSRATGLGQCILYPGDTLRAGSQKYGTVYVDFLIMTE